MLLALLQAVRFSTRSIRRSPGFAAFAVILLALGVGANTAIFSVVDSVLLRPLPYDRADRLVQLWHTPPQSSFPGMKQFAISPANFLDWQRMNHSFEKMAIYGFEPLTLTGTGEPQALVASKVSGDFFSVMHQQPLLGRTLLPEESAKGKEHVAVLSNALWKAQFGANPNVVGRQVQLNGQAYTIVGVMRPAFTKPGFAQLWVPMAMTPQEAAIRSNHNFLGVGLLKRGVTVQQAQADLDAISRQLAQMYPADDKGWGALAIPMRESMVGDVRTPLFVLLGAVAFVLLIACANVANLLLVRTLSRQKEIAIRSALGATRGRLIVQILAEAVLLSLAGGVLGLIVAHFGIELLTRFLADKLPLGAEITLDATILAFALGISLLTGFLSGLLPAIRLSGKGIQESLKEGLGRTDAGLGAGSVATRGLLVGVEVALSVLLLVGAGLMIRTVQKLQGIDPGFDERNVLTMQVAPGANRFANTEQQAQFYTQTLQNVRALPGVKAAGAIDNLPLQGGSNQPFSISGQPLKPLSEQPEVAVRVITPGYLEAMGIRLYRGRTVTNADTGDSPYVVVISRSLAQQFWRNQDAIGQHITLTFTPRHVREVIGIVDDVKQEEIDANAPKPTIYYPITQEEMPPASTGTFMAVPYELVIKTAGDPGAVTAAAIAAIHRVGPDVPVNSVITMREFVGESFAQRRVNLLMFEVFAALALLLAAAGIYSVLAYTVRQRVRELGIRLALGASMRNVMALVLKQGLMPAALGIVAGVLLAIALGRAMQSLVYGVGVRDLATYLCATGLLFAVSVIAGLIPAIRATRIEPLAVLRDE